MAIDLRPGYEPSLDEEFMNQNRSRICAVAWKGCAPSFEKSSLRVNHRKSMTAAGRETRRTMPVRTQSGDS
jgi:hypothetical protein